MTICHRITEELCGSSFLSYSELMELRAERVIRRSNWLGRMVQSERQDEKTLEVINRAGELEGRERRMHKHNLMEWWAREPLSAPCQLLFKVTK